MQGTPEAATHTLKEKLFNGMLAGATVLGGLAVAEKVEAQQQREPTTIEGLDTSIICDVNENHFNTIIFFNDRETSMELILRGDKPGGTEDEVDLGTLTVEPDFPENWPLEPAIKEVDVKVNGELLSHAEVPVNCPDPTPTPTPTPTQKTTPPPSATVAAKTAQQPQTPKPACTNRADVEDIPGFPCESKVVKPVTVVLPNGCRVTLPNWEARGYSTASDADAHVAAEQKHADPNDPKKIEAAQRRGRSVCKAAVVTKPAKKAAVAAAKPAAKKPASTLGLSPTGDDEVLAYDPNPVEQVIDTITLPAIPAAESPIIWDFPNETSNKRNDALPLAVGAGAIGLGGLILRKIRRRIA